MNIVRRRDPFELMGMAGMGRVVQDLMDDPFFGPVADRQETAGLLPLDLSESEDELIVRASLPGFKKEDVDVQVHNGMLMINAQHTEEQEETTERFHRRERRVGTVSRAVALPTDVREDQVRGELRDGVLTLHLPKTPESRPHRIQISDGGTQGAEAGQGQRTAGQGAERRGQGGQGQQPGGKRS